ncbi:MAG: hypothetical protein U9Q07_00260 [Planctomycetota bacterium]|nr:hypothetical protein [Planctomycetota bacterium]
MIDTKIDDEPIESMTSVQIRKATHSRMKRYRNSIMPRPSLTDLATVAIELYLDAHEAGTG